MPQFKIEPKKVDGFAAENAEPGQQLQVIVKGSFTSDDPIFYVYVTNISNLFLNGLRVHLNSITKFLVVQHEDSADIYINDFPELINVQVNRDIKAGEVVYKGDISDIKSLEFPDIEIKPSDVVIYCTKVNWKFGLLFDFTRKLNLDELEVALGALHKELEFQNYLAAIEADITKAKAEDLAQNIPESSFLITEGKTDWKHLKNAISILQPDLNCSIIEFDEDRGDDVTLKMCEHFSKAPHADRYIFMFDRDNPKIIKRLEELTRPGEQFQRWGNNVYSFMIPVPDHRGEAANISIEFYYTDDEIRTKDEQGKRLHFSNELKTEVLPTKQITRIEIDPIESLEAVKKIDADDAASIVNNVGMPVGLSKTAFAENILNRTAGFNNFGVESFRAILQIVKTVNELA